MTDESCLQVEKLLSKSVNAKIIDFGHKEKGFGERIEVHIKRIDKPGASFKKLTASSSITIGTVPKRL